MWGQAWSFCLPPALLQRSDAPAVQHALPDRQLVASCALHMVLQMCLLDCDLLVPAALGLIPALQRSAAPFAEQSPFCLLESEGVLAGTWDCCAARTPWALSVYYVVVDYWSFLNSGVLIF